VALGALSARRLAAGAAGPASHDWAILAIHIHLVADNAGEPAFAYLHIRFAGRWPPALAVAGAVKGDNFPHRPGNPTPHQSVKRASAQPLLAGGEGSLVRHPFEWQGGGAMKTDLLKRITIEPGKCGGRPCIRGMRIRVTDILQLLSAGAPYEEILQDYPDLQRDDILAAIEYAAHQTDHLVLQAV
jgi:uncharacterized protein (DUF433 family)